MELGSGRRIFLWALVVSLCVTAAVAIGTLLFAEFDDTAARILGTTALLSLASLLSLPAGALLDQRRAVLLGWATIAAAVTAFVVSMVVIWGEVSSDWPNQLNITLWLTAGTGAQAAIVTALLRPEDSRQLRVLHGLSIVLGAALATLIAVAVWVEPESAAYGRAVGAVAVAAVLTTLLQPILRRAEAPARRRAELVFRLNRDASEEAVAAAVEALERHGVGVEEVVGRQV
ncbi:MAG TPA: hypothetical protein VK915_14520 [Gaiellaceae bacterium]|nr:hypothetical protein [Gaiellaceae bacterium]